ncbi:unnamed protein product [Protopolystoma xenopodis]|uniref:Uncharacterized protein n=1 Tax=Protopolystoma xenopodis TaxID=117903 RepID=A0A448XFW0_9PLAT|nr:unnamed protein product [Protopolystoma xenopodis]
MPPDLTGYSQRRQSHVVAMTIPATHTCFSHVSVAGERERKADKAGGGGAGLDPRWHYRGILTPKPSSRTGLDWAFLQLSPPSAKPALNTPRPTGPSDPITPHMRDLAAKWTWTEDMKANLVWRSVWSQSPFDAYEWVDVVFTTWSCCRDNLIGRIFSEILCHSSCPDFQRRTVDSVRAQMFRRHRQ